MLRSKIFKAEPETAPIRVRVAQLAGGVLIVFPQGHFTCPYSFPALSSFPPSSCSLSTISQTGPSLQSFVREVKLQSLCQGFPHLVPLVLFRLLAVTFSTRPDQILFSSSRDRDCSTEQAARSTETHCEENTSGVLQADSDFNRQRFHLSVALCRICCLGS